MLGRKVAEELARLKIENAEAFFAITVHRDAAGNAVSTMTIFAEGAAEACEDEFHERLNALCGTLRKSFAREPS